MVVLKYIRVRVRRNTVLRNCTPSSRRIRVRLACQNGCGKIDKGYG
jgi:hypothetical protein